MEAVLVEEHKRPYARPRAEVPVSAPAAAQL
jgi:hypothetical protein